MKGPASPAVPALRWSEADGYGLDSPRVTAALSEGVAGFILFGGAASEAAAATRELTLRAGRPLLFGSDLERGAGQQFSGATALPPLGALGALGDLEVIREAGALTAREAVAMGVPWVFAPVADLALEPDNPIVATRAFGSDPERVGAQVAAWIQGCLSQGGIPCAKHFPGHGRTLEDSHAALPTVRASREALEASDLIPFRRALSAGVPSVMTAHVAYPALDPAGGPATTSRAVVTGMLRDAMAFDGVVVTDALIMAGAGEGAAAVEGALEAGVDLLLYPPEGLDVGALARSAVHSGRLSPEGRSSSLRRIEALIRRIPAEAPTVWGRPEDQALADGWALRTLVPPPAGAATALRGASIHLTVVDDDLGGPYAPPSREPFPEALRRGGVLRADTDPVAVPLLCLYAEPRAWKGRAGLSQEARSRVSEWAAEAGPRGGIAVVFGGPRVAQEVPAGIPVLLAWGGESLMQAAAARWVVSTVLGAVR